MLLVSVCTGAAGAREPGVLQCVLVSLQVLLVS